MSEPYTPEPDTHSPATGEEFVEHMSLGPDDPRATDPAGKGVGHGPHPDHPTPSHGSDAALPFLHKHKEEHPPATGPLGDDYQDEEE